MRRSRPGSLDVEVMDDKPPVMGDSSSLVRPVRLELTLSGT